jgi:hypothetical protein
MQVWSMPGGVTLTFHDPRCEEAGMRLKAEINQSFAGDCLSWIRFLMDGRTCTWAEINASLSKAVNEAMQRFHDTKEGGV